MVRIRPGAYRRLGGPRFSGGRRFRPSSVAGLVLDLNPLAGKTILNGSDVNTVEDSATGDGQQDATQAIAALQPAYTASNSGVNGRPTVDHDSSNGEYLVIGSGLDIGTNAMHLFVVLHGTTDQDNQWILGNRTVAFANHESGWYLQAETSADVGGGATPFICLFADGSDNKVLNDVFVAGVDVFDGAPHLVELSWIDADGTKTIRIYVDGAEAGNISGASLGSIGSSDALRLGARADAALNYFNNSWARMLMYQPSSGIPDADRTRLRDHLAKAYGGAW